MPKNDKMVNIAPSAKCTYETIGKIVLTFNSLYKTC